MDDPLSVPNVIKYWGIAISVAGILVATPSGTSVIWTRVWAWFRHQRDNAHRLVARLLARPPRTANIRGTSAVSLAVSGGRGTITTASFAWSPSAPVEERLDVLHRHLLHLERRHNDLASRLTKDLGELKAGLKELNESLAKEIAAVRRAIAEMDQQTAGIDARGLPVVGLGIILAGIPELLGVSPWIGLPVTFFSTWFTSTTVVQAWRDHKKDRKMA